MQDAEADRKFQLWRVTNAQTTRDNPRHAGNLPAPERYPGLGAFARKRLPENNFVTTSGDQFLSRLLSSGPRAAF